MSTPRATETHVITAADPRDAERVFAVIARAFTADPPSRWLFPDEQQYLRNFPTFARALGGAALAAGTAFSTPDFSGVTLWLPPGATPDEEALSKLIEESVAPEKQEHMAAVAEQMGRYHPEEPHWYLPFIAVEPAQQARGLGSALLAAQLAVCDQARLPAYLESTSQKSQPLYERHGFKAIAEIKVGNCPPIVPMLRRPGS